MTFSIGLKDCSSVTDFCIICVVIYFSPARNPNFPLRSLTSTHMLIIIDTHDRNNPGTSGACPHLSANASVANPGISVTLRRTPFKSLLSFSESASANNPGTTGTCPHLSEKPQIQTGDLCYVSPPCLQITATPFTRGPRFRSAGLCIRVFFLFLSLTFVRKATGTNNRARRDCLHLELRAGVMHPLFIEYVGERGEVGMFGNNVPLLTWCPLTQSVLHTLERQSSNQCSPLPPPSSPVRSALLPRQNICANSQQRLMQSEGSPLKGRS